LKNVNEGKPEMGASAANRKAKTNNLKASMKDFDDSEDEDKDKAKNLSKTLAPGGPKGAPPMASPPPLTSAKSVPPEGPSKAE